MLNGAASVAATAPHVFRLLKPRVSSTIAAPISSAATRSMRIDALPRSPRRVKLRAKTTTAMPSTIMKTGRQPTSVPSVPPMRKALTPEIARADPSAPIAVACCVPR